MGSGEMVSPMVLFNSCEDQAWQIELDRACRETVIRTYKTVYRQQKDTLLFLNINSAILDKVVGSNHLINMVRHYKVSPNDIVIEINESRVKDTNLLHEFVDTYRDYGFLIALDDVGCGFSNLDRIPLARPDIVKTDISLIRNICTDSYVQEVFRSLVDLSTGIGAQVVAEGIETEAEAIQTLELGVHMIQGYYLSRPQKIDACAPESLYEKIKAIADRLQKVERERFIWNRRRYHTMNNIMCDITRSLTQVTVGRFDELLLKSVNSQNDIECGYILDEAGIQCSATVFPNVISGVKKNRLFSPAEVGADHSVKSYYRYLRYANNRKYLTDPYISLATGNLCITFARYFHDGRNSRRILCIDFKVETPMRQVV